MWKENLLEKQQEKQSSDGGRGKLNSGDIFEPLDSAMPEFH